jgi:hypothetical protein
LKKIRKYFPDTVFKQLFLLKENSDNFTFFSCIADFDAFKLAFNFIKSEFGDEILKEILCSEDRYGDLIFNMTTYIDRFTMVLEFFNENLDKNFIRQILMHKNKKNLNIMVRDFHGRFSDPANSSDLLKLFDFIFTHFHKDFELFNDLLKSNDKDGIFFVKKIKCMYGNIKFTKFLLWIKTYLGENYLKSFNFK